MTETDPKVPVHGHDRRNEGQGGAANKGALTELGTQLQTLPGVMFLVGLLILLGALVGVSVSIGDTRFDLGRVLDLVTRRAIAVVGVLLLTAGSFTIVNKFYKPPHPHWFNAFLFLAMAGLIALFAFEVITAMQSTGAVISKWEYDDKDGTVKLYLKPISLRNFQGQKLIAVLRVKDPSKDADGETRFAVSAVHAVPDVSEGQTEIDFSSGPIHELINPSSGLEARLFVVPRTFTGTELTRLGDIVEKRGGKQVDKVGFSASPNLTKGQTILDLYRNLSATERAYFDAHRQ
jgi:hypothetical protein